MSFIVIVNETKYQSKLTVLIVASLQQKEKIFLNGENSPKAQAITFSRSLIFSWPENKRLK